MEETLADVDEFYGRGSEYEVLSHTIYNLLYVIRHKANPPLNAR
jgi:hypothetical protein